VAAAVALAGFAARVAGGLRQLLRFLFQQLVQRFLDAATDKFFDLPLDYFFVQLYNLLGHSLLSPFRMLSRNSILPKSANYVSFCSFCATYCTLS
jgi:fluoride ion exporter CrcB/FEX